MNGLAGQTSFYPPEPAPDPLLCWLWLAHVLGPASPHAGRVLDAFGGAQEAWEARDTFRREAFITTITLWPTHTIRKKRSPHWRVKTMK